MFSTKSDWARADWPLLMDGPINLFWRRSLFESAKHDLQALGYVLINASCESPDRLHADLGTGLRWLEQFGYEPWTGNLDALADAFGVFPAVLGDQTAICLDGFHHFAARNIAGAQGLLDVLAEGARRRLLQGGRLAVLVQTDDADFSTDRLGGTPAHWNEAEWLNVSRGL